MLELIGLDLSPVEPRAHVGHQVGPIAPGIVHLHDVVHGRSLTHLSTLAGPPARAYDLRQHRVGPLEKRMGKLDGKVAIVTGAARGLGRTYAKRLAGLGAKVAVTDINL